MSRMVLLQRPWDSPPCAHKGPAFADKLPFWQSKSLLFKSAVKPLYCFRNYSVHQFLCKNPEHRIPIRRAWNSNSPWSVARKTKVLLTLHLHHYLAQNCRSMCALNSLVLSDMKKLMKKQSPNWVLSALDAVLWSSGAWANFCTCFISARFMSSLHALSICKLCRDKRFNSLSLFQRRSDDDIGDRQVL
jgi:hypothetical protein